MNLTEEFFDFIADNQKSDVSRLLFSLKGKELPFSPEFAVSQILCRHKNEKKLSRFLLSRYFLFPDNVAAEQSSDQEVASYHASLVGTSKHVLDMTSGLGIDSMTMSMVGNDVVACDMNERKCETLVHNLRVMNVENVCVHCGDSVEYLKHTDRQFDVIYIDPSRRNPDNRRAYSLKDCSPNVLEILPTMLSKSNRILIKASPLLDISQLRREIPNASTMHIVCVRGECKEVLIEITADCEFKGVSVIDIDANNESPSAISFTEDELNQRSDVMAESEDIIAGRFLYEPNAGLKKLNISKALCCRYPGLKPVGRNTTLYISEMKYTDFPGRALKIESIPGKSDLKKLKGTSFNVVSKNYPLDVSELRKKYGLKDGSDMFLYAFRATSDDRPTICVAQKIN